VQAACVKKVPIEKRKLSHEVNVGSFQSGFKVFMRRQPSTTVLAGPSSRFYLERMVRIEPLVR
jgi:hypothetical protein